MTEELRHVRSLIDARVRAVPGVVALYPPSSAAVHALTAGAAPALGTPDPGSPVRVRADGEALLVEVALGVGTTAATPRVVRAAYAAIRAALTEWGAGEARIEVTAVHVEPGA